jgi:hypothetical protein
MIAPAYVAPHTGVYCVVELTRLTIRAVCNQKIRSYAVNRQ